MSRLRTWRAAASRIVLIGELYRVRERAHRAIYLGIPLGVVSWVRCRSWWHSPNLHPLPADKSHVAAAEPVITGPHDVIVLVMNLPSLPESW